MHTNFRARFFRRVASACVPLLVAAGLALAGSSALADGTQLGRDAQAALKKLYAGVPADQALGAKAHAVLVFPKVTKAGLLVGGQYGDGAVLRNGKAVGYYNTTGASMACRPACNSSATPCCS